MGPGLPRRGTMRAPGRLVVATGGVLAAYVVALTVPALDVPALLRDDVLGNLALLLPIGILVRRATERPADRSWTLVLALGVCLYLFGNVLYSVLHGAGTVG